MTSQKDRRLTLALLWVSVPVVVCVGILICLILRAPHEDLERELVAIRKAEEPVDMKELVPPPIPERENAAVIYQQAFAVLYKGTTREDSALKDFVSRDPVKADGADRSLVQRVVQHNRRTLELLRKASAMPKCQFLEDWSDPANAIFPHYAKLRACTRLVAADALLKKERGDVEGAVQSCHLILRITQTGIAEPPHLIGLLVEGALYAVGLKTLERTLVHSDVNASTYRLLLKDLEGIKVKAHLARALMGERCMGVSVVESVRTGKRALESLVDDETGKHRSIPRRMNPWVAFMLVRDEAFYLKQMTRFIASARRPEYNWQDIHNHEEWMEREIRRKWYFISALLLPNQTNSLRRTAFMQARIDTTRLALALRMYRQKRGGYPSSLDALAPTYFATVPLDPFSGMPYLYRRVGKGFVVYSVGINRKDDGGVEYPKDWEKGDIVWRSEM